MAVLTGHSGLALAAHLKNLEVPAVIMEQGPKIGNAWAERYESVRTHTITPGDYLPFLRHPSNWPRWQDKAHITGWLDSYARIMGLEVRLNTKVEKAEYDEASRTWTVRARGADGATTVVRADHVVMALGMAGPEPADLDLPGKETFKGLAYYAAVHKSAAEIPDLQNKKVVIVGCATTAHDMAQDFVNHGAKSVTMIQRQPTWSFSAEAIKKYHLGHFTEPGVTTDEADLLINSLPTAVARVFGYSMTQEMIRHDKELLDKLEEAGMRVKRGEDGTSFIDYLFFKGGHFYVDQGATPMILDGRIKVRMCSEGVREYCPEGLVLGDGSKIEADVICIATGFKPAGLQLKELMGDEVWAKACKFGSFNEELERHGVSSPPSLSLPPLPTFLFFSPLFLGDREGEREASNADIAANSGGGPRGSPGSGTCAAPSRGRGRSLPSWRCRLLRFNRGSSTDTGRRSEQENSPAILLHGRSPELKGVGGKEKKAGGGGWTIPAKRAEFLS